MVLISRLRRLTSRCVAKSASGDLKKTLPEVIGAARQADPQRVAEADVIGLGFGNRGAHPGIVEIDDGDDGLSGVQHFALAGGANGNGAA